MQLLASGMTDDPTLPSAQQKRLLRIFVTFAFAALLVELAMLLSREVADRLSPFYPWQNIGFFYGGALIFAIPLFVSRSALPVRDCLNAISVALWVLVGYGAITAAFLWAGNDYGNPYLAATLAQPIWMIGVPLVWIVTFRLSKNSGSRRTQHA